MACTRMSSRSGTSVPTYCAATTALVSSRDVHARQRRRRQEDASRPWLVLQRPPSVRHLPTYARTPTRRRTRRGCCRIQAQSVMNGLHLRTGRHRTYRSAARACRATRCSGSHTRGSSFRMTPAPSRRFTLSLSAVASSVSSDAIASHAFSRSTASLLSNCTPSQSLSHCKEEASDSAAQRAAVDATLQHADAPPS